MDGEGEGVEQRAMDVDRKRDTGSGRQRYMAERD